MDLLDHDVDVLIIGAGIQGAGMAQAAAAAGYRVMVLEKNNVASATSSRSSKLIHGGLRYLESYQFSLVYKALHERRKLLQNAPELVRLVPFYIPIYKDTSRRKLLIRIGLTLYYLLSGLHRSARFHNLPRRECDGLIVKQEQLQTVFQYYDGQTDDVALTKAVMQSAQTLGTKLLCAATFFAAHVTEQGVKVTFKTNDDERQLTCRVLINASGPWVNQVLNRITPDTQGLDIELVQGTHILLDNPAASGAYYVEAPQDQRAIFVMPWRGNTLIGTTESVYEGDPALVEPEPADIEYLLEVYRHYFPNLSDNIIDSFAGVRVLPKLPGSVFLRPRDTILHLAPQRVLSLYGGKLTSYRATAERAMKKVMPFLPRVKRKANTRTIRLYPVRD